MPLQTNNLAFTLTVQSPEPDYRLWYDNRSLSSYIENPSGVAEEWIDWTTITNLKQSNSANRPNISSSTPVGGSSLDFNSTPYLESDPFDSTVNLGFSAGTIYAILRINSFVANTPIFSGADTLNVPFGGLYVGSTNNLAWSSAELASNIDLAVSTWALVTISIDGANSFIQVGGNTPIVDTFPAFTFTPDIGDKLVLGGDLDALSFANFSIAELLVYPSVHGSTELTRTQTYLTAKHGL